MKKLFQLDKMVEEDLPTSRPEAIVPTFEPPLPSTLKSAFKENGIDLTNSAFVMKFEKDDQWRVVDTREESVFAYDILREGDVLNVSQPTASGLSDRLFDYPIFETGLPYLNENGEAQFILFHGVERYFLDDKQKRKWDYFFRPYPLMVGLAHRLKIWELSAETQIKKKGYGKRRILVWFLLLTAIISAVFAGVTEGASLIGAVILLAFWIVQVSKLRKQRRGLNKIKKKIGLYREELRHLEEQLPREIPSDQEISKMYDEELRSLNEKAIESLDLDPDTIMELDRNINRRGFKGIVLEDWALIQPDKTPGRKNLRTEHAEAVVVGENKWARFAVYFVQFIFPTDDLISVYGCFYDFILEEQKGLATDEYFYRNVVSVASETQEVKSCLNPNRSAERTVFKLTVSSGDSIQVALTDERVINDMNRRFEEKSKLKRAKRRNISLRQEKSKKAGMASKEDNLFNESYNEAEPERPERVNETEQLPITRARAAIAFIRRELRAKGRIDQVTG